jgi:hypothetical protein
MPKLFRRLVAYFSGGGNNLAGFKNFLAANVGRVLIISQGHFTHLDNVVQVNGDVLKLRYRPEDLIFFE